MPRASVSIEPLPAWDGYIPEWLGRVGEIWLSRGNQLYRAPLLGAQAQPFARFRLDVLRNIAVRSALGRRLLRPAYNNVVPRPDGTVFAFFDKTPVILHGDGAAVAVDGLKKPFECSAAAAR